MKTSSLFEKSAFVYLITCIFFATMNLFYVDSPASIWELILPIKIYLVMLSLLFLSTAWFYRNKYSFQFRKLITGAFIGHILGIYTDFYLMIFPNQTWKALSNICRCFDFEWSNPENWWSILFFITPSSLALLAAMGLCLEMIMERKIKVKKNCKVPQNDHKNFHLRFKNSAKAMGLEEGRAEEERIQEKSKGNTKQNPIGIYPNKNKDNQAQTGNEEKSDGTKNMAKENSIFREHIEDLKNIEKMLHYTHMLGVNASWGNGKSFVMNEFCKLGEKDKSFYTIHIELLSYGYNEFEKVLLHKLTGLLKEQHIFSIQLEEFRAVLGKNWWGQIIGAFFLGLTDEKQAIWSSMSEVLSYLPRNLLIVYEDLERIDNIEYIKRILSISEKLTSAPNCNVYIIYEYDRQALLEKAGMSPRYLEKYIPHEINLTHMSFYSMVDQILSALRLEKPYWIEDGDLKLLENAKNLLQDAEKFDSYLLSLHLSNPESYLDTMTIRRIIQYLKDITANNHKNGIEFHNEKENLGPNAPYSVNLERHIIEAFSFVKNFMPDEYIRLSAEKSVLKLSIFSIMESEKENHKAEIGGGRAVYKSYYDITHDSSDSENEELMEKAQRSLSSSLENRRAYSMLIIFGYIDVFNMLGHSDEYDENGKPLRPWFGMSEGLRQLYALERNAFIDHMVWHLLQNGISSGNGPSFMYCFFKRHIRDEKNKQAREEEWLELHAIAIDPTSVIGKGTIYVSTKLENNWVLIALGLLVLEETENEWLKLLNYFQQYAVVHTNDLKQVSFIGFLTFIDARYEKVYKFCVKLFNEACSMGKFEGQDSVDEERMVNFSVRYISLLSHLVPQLSEKRKLAEIWCLLPKDNKCDYLEQEFIGPLISEIEKSKSAKTEDSSTDDLLTAHAFLLNVQKILKGYRNGK